MIKEMVKNCANCGKKFIGVNSSKNCKDKSCRNDLRNKNLKNARDAYRAKIDFEKAKEAEYMRKEKNEPDSAVITKISETKNVGKKERFVSRVAKCKCGETLGRKGDDECANCYSISLRGVVLNPTSKEWLNIESKPYKR